MDQVEVLETNLDDVTGEIIGHAMHVLLDAGALDVYFTPIQLKKNRPATKLTVLCSAALRPTIESLIFRETTTLGIRHWTAHRSKLPREVVTVETPCGTVSGKQVTQPDGSLRFAPEFDECQALSRQHQLPLREIMRVAGERFTGRASKTE